jgi:hypothetical protein
MIKEQIGRYPDGVPTDVKGLRDRKYLLGGVRTARDIAKISVTEDLHEPCTLDVSVALMVPGERGKRFNEILRVNRLTLEERLDFST